MTEPDMEDAVDLIAEAMNRDEAGWARETMEFHFACKKNDIDSGRGYYVWRDQGRIQGLVGLHRYLWGPRENVWLAWFAVHPELHGTGVGSAMLDEVEERARQAGYRKFLIETYDGPTFEKARSFYQSKGFSQVGRIENYLPDGSAMLVFGKEL